MLTAALAILSLGAPPQDALEKKISFTSVAINAKKLLADLSENSGTKLLIAQALDKEMVVVSVKDVPLKTVMAKLAEVMLGEWKKEGEAYRLEPDEAAEQKARKAENGHRTTEYAKAIEKLVKGAGSEPLTAEGAARVANRIAELWRKRETLSPSEQIALNEAGKAAPLSRLSFRLFPMLNVDDLGALLPGDRVVFSSSPNRTQRPFKGDAGKALAAFIADQNVWAETARRALDAAGAINEPYHPLTFNRRVDGPLEVLISVTRSGFEPMLLMEVQVLNPPGEVVAKLMKVIAAERAAPIPYAGGPTDQAVIQPSAKSALLLDFYKERAKSRGAELQAPDSIRRMLSHPDDTDLLSLLPSDVLIGYARICKLNLVASLPDEAYLSLGFYIRAQPLTRAVIESTLRNSRDVDAKTSDGWLVVSPQAPMYSRRQRLDRPGFGRFARSVAAAGYVTLDDYAAFALTSSDTYQTLFTTALLGLTVGDLGLVGSQSLSALRIYGSLNAPQKQNLLQDGRLPIARMDLRQKALLSSMVFGARPSMLLVREESPQPDQESTNEPTEIFPNGLPPQGYMTMKGATEEGAIPVSTDRYWSKQFLNYESVAVQLLAKEQPGKFIASDSDPTDEYLFGTRKTYDIRLELSPVYYVRETLSEAGNTLKWPKTKYEQMPEAFRARVARALVEWRKRYENAPSRNGGGPPPP